MMQFEAEARKSRLRADSESSARYLVLGDFGGRSTEPLTVDRDNIDAVLARLEVTLAELRMRGVEDFHPDNLYARMDEFAGLRSEEEEPAPARSGSTPRADLEEILRPSSLLEQITGGGDPFQQYVRELARAAAAPAKANDAPRLAALGERMRALLHHPRFQALEAAWRGLDFVLRQADDESAKVHVAQFSRDDLMRDLTDATNLRTTRTYALLHARPWRGVFGLYSFGSSAADIELLGRIALIASDAHAPFVAEGSVDMGEHWSELQKVPEADHLALALPRFLLRLPYGAKTSKVDAFAFEEMPDVLKGSTPKHAEYLWGHPALAVLTVLARMAQDEDENDEDENLDLRGLPVHNYQQDGEWTMTPCAEVWMTEHHVRALIELGMIPLVSFRDQDRVRVAGLQAITGAAMPNW
jgi:type VI secretion system protein ImpC